MFGAPNLLNGVAGRTGVTLLAMGLSKLWDMLFPGATWGVYKVGTNDVAIEVSSVVDLDLSADSRVSDYIIETGSFASYNKVANPDIISIRMTKDGSDTDRLQLLYWLNQHKKEESLFDILTPEWRHPSMTLIAYRVRRSARSGAAMIVADCLFQEIREKPAIYSTSKIEDPENQPETPTARANPLAGEPNSAGGDVAWA